MTNESEYAKKTTRYKDIVTSRGIRITISGLGEQAHSGPIEDLPEIGPPRRKIKLKISEIPSSSEILTIDLDFDPVAHGDNPIDLPDLPDPDPEPGQLRDTTTGRISRTVTDSLGGTDKKLETFGTDPGRPDPGTSDDLSELNNPGRRPH